jgi:hypothetical protein
LNKKKREKQVNKSETPIMQHPIHINIINDANGIPPSADGVMQIFIKAVPIAGTFDLNKAYLLTSLDDLTPMGINEAYDDINSVAVYQQVSEFYNQAGTGALLWLVGVEKATPYATFVASSRFQDLIRFTAQQDPLNRSKMLGLCYEVPANVQAVSDFPVDVTATLTALETVRLDLFSQGYQFSAILDGYNMSSDVTPAALGSMATKSAPGLSLCITGTKPNGVSAVGMALGRFARISIGHGFGAVEDGPVNTNAAFLTNSIIATTTDMLNVGDTYTVQGLPNATVTYNGITYKIDDKFITVAGQTSFTSTNGGYLVNNYTPVQQLSPAYINQLGQKQFMFLRTWFNHSGFYWNDGATCEQPNRQLSTQEYNRVANALSADALAFFIAEMGKNLPLDISTGAVDSGYLNAKQVEFYNSYIAPLSVASGTGDLSDGNLILFAPNFNSTKRIEFEIDIVPTPILGSVNGKIRFSGTL